MNVALPALVIFLLFLPGFIFWDRFKRTERTALDYAPFGRVVAEAVLWALGLHAFWLGGAWLFREQYFHIETLMELLSASPGAQAHAIETTRQRAAWVVEYFGSLFLGSLIAPSFLRSLITHFRLDRAGQWLTSSRFQPLSMWPDSRISTMDFSTTSSSTLTEGSIVWCCRR